MIWRVLRTNISIGQILGYALANLIGLAIVLSAIKFYGDVSSALKPDDDSAIVSQDYLVLSKKVSLLNTLSGSATEFTDDEIEDLKSQPWVSDVGAFTSADFNVAASVNFGGQGMQTYMFMESIPDAFIDVKPEEWRFNPNKANQSIIPIILSKDYLALYNFGFAASRGLPQISEGMISQIPINLYLSGNGHYEQYQARIVGFSSRLNTIAVPEAFMQWANDRYSSTPNASPSRLIVKVNRPGDPEINEYIEDEGYEVAGDKIDNSRASYFLTLLTTIIITIGAIISTLSLFILMLSIHLLLQKNKTKISNLLLLGYTPSQISVGYYRLIGLINCVVLILAITAMFIASSLWSKSLSALDIRPTSPLTAIMAGIIIVAVITAINFVSIRHTINRTFRQ